MCEVSSAVSPQSAAFSPKSAAFGPQSLVLLLAPLSLDYVVMTENHSSSSRRALVTGGAGFIGSHVADLFISEGLRRSRSSTTSRLVGVRTFPKTAKLHEVSVTSPEAATIVREGKFDVVVHLAAQIDVRKSVADPLFDANTNIIGTLNILEAIRESGHQTRFAFTSTGGAIYGDFNTPPNVETLPKDPESPYAISKLAAEYYLAYYGRLHGLEHVALRFGNVYGPRQDPHGEAGVVAIFCTRILEGKPLTIFGDGLQTRDYVYVGDVARAVFLGATGTLPAAGSRRRARVQRRYWRRHVGRRARATPPGSCGKSSAESSSRRSAPASSRKASSTSRRRPRFSAGSRRCHSLRRPREKRSPGLRSQVRPQPALMA